MTVTMTQKVIKIGTSHGVTLPAKTIKSLDIKAGDELELIVRKKMATPEDGAVLDIAQALMERYRDDFRHLADR